jgi:hypothetical protein
VDDRIEEIVNRPQTSSPALRLLDEIFGEGTPKECDSACPKCRQPVLLGAKFCDSCGTKLVSLRYSQAVQRRCQGCGVGLPAGAAFCDECGMKV